MVSTVDAFQGAERDIIIVATTRVQGGTSKSSSCGGSTVSFLDDPRRANVAMTRAKCHLVVLAVPALLKTTKYWAPLVDIAMAVSKDGWTLLPPGRANAPWSLSRRADGKSRSASAAGVETPSQSSSTLSAAVPPLRHGEDDQVLREADDDDDDDDDDEDDDEEDQPLPEEEEEEEEEDEEAQGFHDAAEDPLVGEHGQRPASSDPWSGGDEEFL
jgi:ATP-dependent exoDNAse (exonuclease V) beta subunit